MLTLVTNLVRHRELLWNLTLRDIKSRYAQSFLGIAWAIIQPVSLVLTFTLLGKLVNIDTEGIPGPVFNFAGVLLWTFFSAGLNTAIASVVSNASLVRKIYFPREIFPMAAIAATAFDMAISTAIFAGFLVAYKVQVTAMVLLAPVILVVQVVLMLAIALIGAGLNVYFRDIRTALPLVFQIWMFATPVFYSAAKVPDEWKAVYFLNPMAHIVENFRRVVLKGLPPDYFSLLIALVLSLVLLFVCYKLFRRLEKKFADVI
jgi:lipopolysaccharide transport system permease protein